jgi:hypothetical protein
MSFYPDGARVPESLRTLQLFLRPLRESDATLDYAAVMSSADQLRRWSQTDWPADGFTLEENRADLRRHEREHDERQAFTFTVLHPARTSCLGCVYIKPAYPELASLSEGASHPADVAFWVRSSELTRGLDRHLLLALREWLAAQWAFDRVFFTIGQQNARQATLLRDAGLVMRLEFTLADGRACWAFA